MRAVAAEVSPQLSQWSLGMGTVAAELSFQLSQQPLEMGAAAKTAGEPLNGGCSC